MHAHAHNTIGESIARYLEGELSDVEQLMLFTTLAKVQEARERFQEALAIDAALKADTDNAPPQAVKNALMRRAGIAAVPQGAAGAAAGKKGLSYASAGAGMLLAALLAGVATFGFMGGRAEQDAQTYRSGQSGNTANHSASVPVDVHAPVLAAQAAGTAALNSAAPEHPSGIHAPAVTSATHTRAPVAYARNAGNEGQQHKAQPGAAPLLIEAVLLRDMAEGLYTEALDVPLPRALPVQAPDFRIREQGHTDTMAAGGFALRLEGLHGLSYEHGNPYAPQPVSGLNNIALALLYQMGKQHAFSLEAGRESLQIYDVIRAGNAVRLDQSHRIQWLGGGYRYTISAPGFPGGTQPYAGLLAGGSDVGPLAKLRAGVSYRATENLRLYMGLDGTVQLYRFENAWLSTKKVNFLYGIEWSF